MKFGKIHDPTTLDKLDLSLPKEPQESLEYLKSLKKEDDLRIYVGAPAWGVKDWRGKIYPDKLKAEEFLNYYAKSFNSVSYTHLTLPTNREV